MLIGPFSPRICGHLANNACLDTCVIDTSVSPAGWGVGRPWVLGLPLLKTFVWSWTTFLDFSYFRSIISVWPQESYEDEIVPQWKHILKSRNKLTTPRMAVLHLDTYVQVQNPVLYQIISFCRHWNFLLLKLGSDVHEADGKSLRTLRKLTL